MEIDKTRPVSQERIASPQSDVRVPPTDELVARTQEQESSVGFEASSELQKVRALIDNLIGTAAVDHDVVETARTSLRVGLLDSEEAIGRAADALLAGDSGF